MVLDVAINGNADAIVTNNTRHFREAAERFDIGLLTPAESGAGRYDDSIDNVGTTEEAIRCAAPVQDQSNSHVVRE